MNWSIKKYLFLIFDTFKHEKQRLHLGRNCTQNMKKIFSFIVWKPRVGISRIKINYHSGCIFLL